MIGRAAIVPGAVLLAGCAAPDSPLSAPLAAGAPQPRERAGWFAMLEVAGDAGPIERPVSRERG